MSTPYENKKFAQGYQWAVVRLESCEQSPRSAHKAEPALQAVIDFAEAGDHPKFEEKLREIITSSWFDEEPTATPTGEGL